MEALWQYIPDYGATVVLVTILFLQHKRTMERDRQFYEVLLVLSQSLMDCVKSTQKDASA